jgi:methionyl-tRNA synthetase
LAKFEINKACDLIWEKISAADKFVQNNQPFKTIKTDTKKGIEQIAYLLRELAVITKLLFPILPETAAKMLEALMRNKVETALFLRK